MNCPNCNHPLVRIRYAEVNVFQCNQCRGHLVENHRVKTIERKRDKDIAALAGEIGASDGADTIHKIRCPRCRNRMDKKLVKASRKFSVDECRNCDYVWLDGGELAAIQVAFSAREQTVEINRMRKRLASMTEAQRNEYETRIANLIERGTEMELMNAVAEEMVCQYYLGCFRLG